MVGVKKMTKEEFDKKFNELLEYLVKRIGTEKDRFLKWNKDILRNETDINSWLIPNALIYSILKKQLETQVYDGLKLCSEIGREKAAEIEKLL